MTYKQLTNVNTDPYIMDAANGVLKDWLGWCLAYAWTALGAQRKYAEAAIAWNNVQYRHADRGMPSGVYVPIWFSHVGRYNGEKTAREWGHVAIWKDGKIYSSPISHKPFADVWNSIEELERNYNAKFLGWSEDINGVRVIEATGQGGGTVATDLITKTDVDLIRQISSEMKGWDFNDVHTGKVDQQELNAWAGQTVRRFVQEAWNESDAWRQKRNAALAYYGTKAKNDETISGLQKSVDSLTTQLEAIRKTAEGSVVSLEEYNVQVRALNDTLIAVTRERDNYKSIVDNMPKEAEVDKNSPASKGVRTAYQALAGILPLAYVVVSSPEFQQALTGRLAWGLAIAPVIAGLVAFIQNKSGN